MIDLLLEGIDSLRLPCSWVLLVPGVAIVVFGRRRTPLVVASFTTAATVVAWLRFAGWWFAVPTGGVQVVIGVAILTSIAIAWQVDSALYDGLIAAIVGISAAWTWIPCVGPHLGDIINGSRDDPLQHIAGTTAFMSGQFLPLILAAAVGVAIPSLGRRLEHRAIVAGGAALVTIVGLLFVTTLFDDVASELARRSTF